MKKKYNLHLLFLLVSYYSFSQNHTTDKVTSEQAVTSPTKESKPTELIVLSKKQLPPDQKVTPEVFYIVNDRPVDRLKYQQHLQQTTSKK